MAITKVSAALVDLDGGVVINESSADADFRVESNGNTHMLFVDGGNDRVGIGVAPTHHFNLEGTGTVEARFRSSDGDMSLQISSDADETHSSELNFMSGTSGRGSIVYDHNTTAASQSMIFKTGDLGVSAMTILGSGNVGIGTSNPGGPLQVQMTHTSTDVTAANSNETLILGNAGSGDGVYNAIKFGGNQQDMYIMSFNDNTQADRRLGFFLGSVAGDAVADERLSIRGNGNVGIGNPSPGFLLDLLTSSGNSVINLKSTTGGDPEIQFDSAATNRNGVIRFLDQGAAGGEIIYAHNGNSMAFKTANSEAVRINSTGVVMLGTTTSKAAGDNPTDENSAVIGRGYLYLQRDDSASINQIVFGKNGQIAGRIVTTTATSLVSASDYRMKENVDYTWDATTRLKQLKPARYNWIADETNTLEDGFLAHEVSSVVPNAVFGEKDAVDSDGNPDMQGVDSSKLIPLLVKTIQELEARITTLEG